MNKFCKSMILPVSGTQFKLATNNEIVKYINYGAGTGGDFWLVEYLTGELKGKRATLSADLLKDHKPKYSFKKKKVIATIIHYKLSKNYKLSKLWTSQLELSSVSLKTLQKELMGLNAGSTIKHIYIEDFANITQKELSTMIDDFNKTYNYFSQNYSNVG